VAVALVEQVQATLQEPQEQPILVVVAVVLTAALTHRAQAVQELLLFVTHFLKELPCVEAKSKGALRLITKSLQWKKA
jgi:hypothetical protein